MSLSSFSPTESRADVLLGSLQRFYAAPRHLRVLTDVLRGKCKLSLRTLDWLCTNYAKKHNITYVRNGAAFNVYLDYKASLKAFSKKSFDPFQRRERLEIADADGVPLQTTLAQLCFFRWAISRGVLDYAVANAAAIEADMLAATRHRAPKNPAKKRQELSKAATKTATRKRVTVNISFQ